MYSSCDEFFDAAGLAVDQHGAVGGRDGFDRRKKVSKYGTVADNFLEVEFVANLVFEVELFLGELFGQLGNLLIGQGVIDGDGDLAGDLNEEFNFMRSERVFSQACNGKDAERAAAAHQWKRAVREQAFLRGLVTAGVCGDVVGVANPWIAGEEHLAGKAFERQ